MAGYLQLRNKNVRAMKLRLLNFVLSYFSRPRQAGRGLKWSLQGPNLVDFAAGFEIQAKAGRLAPQCASSFSRNEGCSSSTASTTSLPTACLTCCVCCHLSAKRVVSRYQSAKPQKLKPSASGRRDVRPKRPLKPHALHSLGRHYPTCRSRR